MEHLTHEISTMRIENWIALGAAAISLCTLFLSAWQARQATKERKSAEEAAERAINAAEDSASSQKRIADAIEKMNSKYSPNWHIKHHGGSTYLLINNSNEAAFHVTVETDSPVKVGDKYKEAELQPQSSLQFWHVEAWDAECEGKVKVTWRRPSETVYRTWNGHVPPK